MKWSITQFGGVNQADQDDVVLARSHKASEGGMSQIAPHEARDMTNLDFADDGIRKRRGQTLYKDFTSAGLNILLTDDELISGITWNNPSTGDLIEVIVSKKTIYTNQSGEFVQVNDSAGAAYTHAADVSKCTFAKLDGHLFIGLDGSNQIQVYKSGADLDPEMLAGNNYEEAFSVTTHVITGTWATGTYLLEAFQTRLFFSDGNTFVEYTPQAFTSSSGIWNLGGATAGFLQASGSIRTLTSFTPDFTNQLNQALYIGTEAGFDVTTGVASTDVLVRVSGAEAPINYKTVVKSPNWLIYLSDAKNIYGINGTNVINLGRRLKNAGKTGSLDKLALDSSRLATFSNSHGIYSSDKSQAVFFYNEGGLIQSLTIDGGIATTSLAATPAVVDGFVLCLDGGIATTTEFPGGTVDGGRTITNGSVIALDFKLGEPVQGENQQSFERRVRLLPWQYNPTEAVSFFIHAYETRTKVIGILQTGKMYELENGLQDIASVDIDSEWESINFKGGASDRIKQFFRLQGMTRTQLVGTPTINFSSKINERDTNFSTDTWSVLDTTAEKQSRYSRLNVRAESLKFTLESLDQYDFRLYSLAMHYDIGAELLE
jgi:hypothetical protein